MPRVAAGVEQVQPLLLIGQLARQVGQRARRAGGGQLGGHPQRQRQPAALLGQRRGGPGVGVDPRADQRPQQRRPRPAAAAGPGPGGRRRPGPPARPAHRGWSPPPRRPGVPGSSGRTCSADRGVVQHDQHPSPGQQAAVPGGALVFVRPGCPGRARPARAGTRPARRPRAPAGRGRSRAGSRTAARRGTGPATWCAQCTASAVLPTPAVPPIAEITTVRGMLAPSRPSSPVSAASSAARPENCRDRRPAAPAAPSPARAAAEHRPAAAGRLRGAQGRVGGQDPLVQLPQLGARLDAELVHQEPAGRAGRRPAPRPAARAVQGQHQLAVQLLAQRMGRGQAAQARRPARRAGPAAVRRRSAFPPPAAAAPPAAAPRAAPAVRPHVGQRLAAPQRQRRTRPVGRGLPRRRPARPCARLSRSSNRATSSSPGSTRIRYPGAG